MVARSAAVVMAGLGWRGDGFVLKAPTSTHRGTTHSIAMASSNHIRSAQRAMQRAMKQTSIAPRNTKNCS